jgi:hypothetical protein
MNPQSIQARRIAFLKMNPGFAIFEPFTKQYQLFNGNVRCLEIGFDNFEMTFRGAANYLE